MEKTLAVAKFFNELYKSANGTDMDQMRMHKMMYLAQRESLMYNKELLFDAEFYGWKYGPVLVEVRSEYTTGNMFAGVLIDLSETAKNTKEPISLHGEFHKSLQPQIKQVFQKYVTPDNFEKVVKWYMEKQGATHVYIPAKNEKGKSEYADADIIAEFEELKLIFYIQAKKHSGESGDWAVTQISRYKEQMADSDSDYTYVLWVVSSADDFSGEAKLQAQANNVRLINGDEFYSMILNAGISNMNF